MYDHGVFGIAFGRWFKDFMWGVFWVSIAPTVYPSHIGTLENILYVTFVRANASSLDRLVRLVVNLRSRTGNSGKGLLFSSVFFEKLSQFCFEIVK